MKRVVDRTENQGASLTAFIFPVTGSLSSFNPILAMSGVCTVDTT